MALNVGASGFLKAMRAQEQAPVVANLDEQLLLILSRAGLLSRFDLARQAGVDVEAVHREIEAMTERGLLQRDDQDGVSLSVKGERVVRIMRPASR
jgi:predicted transcriptional regulator